MARSFRAEPFILIWWVVLMFGWILMLAANAALQQNCSSAGHGALALTGAVGYLGPGLSCSKFYGFTWWVTWYVFFLVVLVPALAATGGVPKFRAGLLALLALAAMLVGDVASTFFYWKHLGVGGTPQDRAMTMLAGAIIASIALYLLILTVGVVDEKRERVEATGEPKGETYGGVYLPKEGTEPAGGTFNATYEAEGPGGGGPGGRGF